MTSGACLKRAEDWLAATAAALARAWGEEMGDHTSASGLLYKSLGKHDGGTIWVDELFVLVLDRCNGDEVEDVGPARGRGNRFGCRPITHGALQSWGNHDFCCFWQDPTFLLPPTNLQRDFEIPYGHSCMTCGILCSAFCRAPWSPKTNVPSLIAHRTFIHVPVCFIFRATHSLLPAHGSNPTNEAGWKR